MLQIKVFAFNELQENTSVLYDESKECVIIDAGCNNLGEQQELSKFIRDNELKPVMLLNTHGHFDHIMGNAYVEQAYGLLPRMHRADLFLIENSVAHVAAFGMKMETPPTPINFLEDAQVLRFGSSELKVIHTPGHSPGGVCFYSANDNLLIAGDTLFNGSIGRTDLPGGDYDELMSSIRNKLMLLPSDTRVVCGHGPGTTIGNEAMYNPFLN